MIKLQNTWQLAFSTWLNSSSTPAAGLGIMTMRAAWDSAAKCIVAKYVWQNICGQKFVAKYVWQSYCGKTVVAKYLWLNICDQTLWLQKQFQYSKMKKPDPAESWSKLFAVNWDLELTEQYCQCLVQYTFCTIYFSNCQISLEVVLLIHVDNLQTMCLCVVCRILSCQHFTYEQCIAMWAREGYHLSQ